MITECFSLNKPEVPEVNIHSLCIFTSGLLREKYTVIVQDTICKFISCKVVFLSVQCNAVCFATEELSELTLSLCVNMISMTSKTGSDHLFHKYCE